MNHNANLIKHFSKLSPRKEYIYCWERGQWYEGYDGHWDSNQRIKHSRICEIKHRNKKNKKYKGAIMDKKYLNNVLGVLKEVEYAGDYEEPDYDWDEEPIEGIHYACCPVCGSVLYGENDHYHEEDCRLYKLIKQTEEMLK